MKLLCVLVSISLAIITTIIVLYHTENAFPMLVFNKTIKVETVRGIRSLNIQSKVNAAQSISGVRISKLVSDSGDSNVLLEYSKVSYEKGESTLEYSLHLPLGIQGIWCLQEEFSYSWTLSDNRVTVNNTCLDLT